MTATINASTSAGVVTTADTSGILQLQTNGTAALTVDASQNVGIGTASPSQKLTVAGAGTAARLEVINTSDTNRGGYLRDTGSTFELGTNSGVRPLAFAFDGSEKMRIDSSGNVGIGTSSPARRLHVKAAGVTTLANSNGALFTDASNAGVLLGSDNALGYVQGVTVAGTATVGLVLQPLGGDMSVGTTTSRGKVYVQFDTNSSATPTVYFGNDGGTGVFASFGNSSGTVIGTIARSGSNTAYNTSSDYRLKEAIAPMTGALAKVIALKPCTYKWKVDGSDGQGFIAHELDEVVPGCVTGEKDAVDAEGNPQYQSIDTSFLVATLTSAIQELKAIVDAQAARITALESAP